MGQQVTRIQTDRNETVINADERRSDPCLTTPVPLHSHHRSSAFIPVTPPRSPLQPPNTNAPPPAPNPRLRFSAPPSPHIINQQPQAREAKSNIHTPPPISTAPPYSYPCSSVFIPVTSPGIPPSSSSPVCTRTHPSFTLLLFSPPKAHTPAHACSAPFSSPFISVHHCYTSRSPLQHPHEAPRLVASSS